MANTGEYEGNPERGVGGRAGITIDDSGYELSEGVNGPSFDRDDLRVVRGNEIGAGTGLDEAELARLDPLDGRPWDEDRDDELFDYAAGSRSNSQSNTRESASSDKKTTQALSTSSLAMMIGALGITLYLGKKLFGR